MSVLEELDQIRAQLSAPGQPFEMAETPINGVALPVYKNLPRNLTYLLVQALNFGDRTFIVNDDRRLTYKTALERAAGLAELLGSRYGVASGTHVAIAMRNSPEWIISFFAALLTGATAVLINSRGTPDEIGHALRDTDCTMLLADAKRAQAAASVYRGELLVARQSGDFCDRNDRGVEIAAAVPHPSFAEHQDSAIIMFTSGTTGRPKGAVLSHRSVYTCLFAMQHNGAANLIRTAKQMGTDPEVLARSLPQMAALAIFPFFHVSGSESMLLGALLGGNKIVIMDRWDPAAALALIDRERIGILGGPPSIFWDLLGHPDLARTDVSSLKHVGTGGQATPRHLLNAMMQAFPNAVPGGGYGQTETNGAIATGTGEEFLAKPHASGRILPGTEVRIVSDDGEDLPLGRIGEIWVRSALVMNGYWNQPRATQAAFSGTWLRTGDIGFIDADRFITIVDRKTEMIIRGGENIYCAELERVFCEYPGILEAAAFGVPDNRWGERAVIAVVAQPGTSLAVEQLDAFVRNRLADYKIPQIMVSSAPLVRNAIGKIDRALLKKQYGATAA